MSRMFARWARRNGMSFIASLFSSCLFVSSPLFFFLLLFPLSFLLVACSWRISFLLIVFFSSRTLPLPLLACVLCLCACLSGERGVLGCGQLWSAVFLCLSVGWACWMLSMLWRCAWTKQRNKAKKKLFVSFSSPTSSHCDVEFLSCFHDGGKVMRRKRTAWRKNSSFPLPTSLVLSLTHFLCLSVVKVPSIILLFSSLHCVVYIYMCVCASAEHSHT